MRRFVSIAGGFALTLLLLPCTSGGRAEDGSKLEEGFTSLFDGKDLTGWRYGGSKEKLDGKTETADGRFKVENGAIVLMEKDNTGKAGGKELTTIKSWPKEFHLKLEFKAALKADGGVVVRGQRLQVRDFLRRNEKKHLKSFKNDDWNTLDVVVRHNQLVTTVDKRMLTDADLLEMTVEGGKTTAKLNGKEIDPRDVQVSITSVAVCRCNGEPLEVVPLPAAGSVGLRAETGKISFRNLRIKEQE
jgi:hypothetical protein